jgi:hypothetical protein
MRKGQSHQASSKQAISRTKRQRALEAALWRTQQIAAKAKPEVERA